jgi:hypothetical protein
LPFAIMQESLDPPPTVEQLAQAFAGLPGFTRQDGALQAKDAFGILAAGLPREQAAALEKALRSGGVPVVAVDEDAIPALPPPKVLTRADLLPEAFVYYDALGRPQRAQWSEVILFAAGNVLLTQLRRQAPVRFDVPGAGVLDVGAFYGLAPLVSMAGLPSKIEKSLNLQIEIVLNGHPNRYRISARQFTYAYLGAEVSPRATDNFLHLFRDLLGFAPSASRNRGADYLAGDPPRLMAYPSRHAFEEECVWCLWRRGLPMRT